MTTTIWLAALLTQATTLAPPAPDGPDVIVLGARERFRMSGRALRAAQQAFADHRDRFAPASSLRFTVEDRSPAAVTRPLSLRLTDGVTSHPIALAADRSFALPAIPDGTWWLEADRPKRGLIIKPLVVSPGYSRFNVRLGDARLQCRAYWAMAKATAPLLAAPVVGMLDLAGPCSSSRIGIYEATPRAIRTAALSEGARTKPLDVSRNRRSYRLPLADRAFGNDARMTVAIEDAYPTP